MYVLMVPKVTTHTILRIQRNKLVYAGVAQLVEQNTLNVPVVGSSPITSKNLKEHRRKRFGILSYQFERTNVFLH